MNKKYTLSASTKANNLVSALQDYYGAGVTICYSTSTVVVFFCGAISDKYIKIDFQSNCYGYYGDAWTSGATITNSVNFAYAYNISSSSYSAYAILCPNSIMIKVNGSSYSFVFIIGHLSNGKHLAMCLSSYTSISYNQSWLTNGTRVWIATMNGRFKSTSGMVVTLPIYMFDGKGVLLTNDDGTPAYIMDIYQSPSVSTVESSTNFYSVGGGSIFLYGDLSPNSVTNALFIPLV